jgi:D-psicose/D-tagatose/L-ribulose 3-epimerase
MRIAISNIAWKPWEDEEMAELLPTLGVRAIEIAPTRIDPDPLSLDANALATYRRLWNDHGLEIVAMQALLFQRPDLTIFGEQSARSATRTYLERMADIAVAEGAGVMVFGSPGNRRTSGQARETIDGIAEPFFRALGDHAHALGTTLCIEPNPPQYGCDFVATSSEAIDLVGRVASLGFGLHLDAAAMTLAGEIPEVALPIAIPLLRHFHISEPDLAPIGAGGTRHKVFASLLRDSGYGGWMSVEMRAASETSNREAVTRALDVVFQTYGKE